MVSQEASRGIIETAAVAFVGKSAFELTLGSFDIGPQLTRHGVTVWYNMENHSDTSHLCPKPETGLPVSALTKVREFLR